MTFEEWRQDLRRAWRGLRQARGFAGTAVFTLAIGIAGASVMFALVQGVLLRPLVYLPAAQFMFAADAILLRTTLPTRAVAGAARDRIRAVDPAVR